MIARAAAALAMLAVAGGGALAQTCPEPLASARRLALVTADGMATPQATLQWFERARPGTSWRAAAAPEPALIGKTGMAWSYFFRALARPGEPVKVEGDKRAPAGFYRIGRPFGFAASGRAGYTRIAEGMTCVDDLRSPDYNTVVRGAPRGERMWRVPEYRRGLFVEYPTNHRARAGSCIFIHVRLPDRTGTSGCVALPEDRVAALQDFAAPGAVLAILPRAALPRLAACLPPIN